MIEIVIVEWSSHAAFNASTVGASSSYMPPTFAATLLGVRPCYMLTNNDRQKALSDVQCNNKLQAYYDLMHNLKKHNKHNSKYVIQLSVYFDSQTKVLRGLYILAKRRQSSPRNN